MVTPRISASAYSNTAPLVWSFLYGSGRGSVELILDNAPARSAELLAQDRVDAALVPIIASQTIEDVRIVPDVCVGAKQSVRSVCLVTKGGELTDVRSVALDVSSQTSVVLTKVIFREFLGFEPSWLVAAPDVDVMLKTADCALLIGDPALRLAASAAEFRVFDLAQLWHTFTGLGFVFAMWMTLRNRIDIDLAAARDEGLAHLEAIAANYAQSTGLGPDEMLGYLSSNISYFPDGPMTEGMELYFRLAEKHGLIDRYRPLEFV